MFWSRGLGLECLLLKEPRFFRASKGRSWGGANDTGVIPVRVALVLYRIDPHFSAMIGASWDGKVETIKSFSALSEVPGSACAQSGMDFGEKLVVIGIVLLEHADVSISAGDVHALPGGVVIQIVRILNGRKRSNQSA